MIASKDLGEFGTLRPLEKDSEKLRKRDTRNISDKIGKDKEATLEEKKN